MPSPPKPWETRSTRSNSNVSRSFSFSSNRSNSTSVPLNNSSASPHLENNSTSILSTDNMNRPYMSSSYGTGYNSGYGSSYGAGYGSSYGTGLGYGGGYGSGLGGYNNMGSYGGMMGGYGTGYSGYGGYNRMGPHSLYGGSMGPGMPGEPSLAAQMAQSTQSTFQILERVVGTFGGVAQMLESTYFATQSSFMAMVGVAEQFGMLKNMFTNVFSIFAIYKYVRNFLYRILGKRPPADPKEINANDFQQFSDKPKYSLRPFLMFLSLVFGVPYLLHLFMRSVARRLAQQQQNIASKQLTDGAQKFEFAQALYNFVGQNPAELSFNKGDLIAILSRGPEPTNGPPVPQWWQGRLRDGRVGMFPNNYVEILEKKVEVSEKKIEVPERKAESPKLSPLFSNRRDSFVARSSGRLSKDISNQGFSASSQDTIYTSSPIASNFPEQA